MQKHIALSALLLSMACFRSEADACTCRREPVEMVYKRSAQVFVAEVIKVRQLRSKSKHKDTVIYKAVLKPKRIFKGRNPGSIAIKYEVLRASSSIDGEEVLIVGGCHSEYSIGREYVIMTSPGESLDWQDWCSNHIHALSRVPVDYLESLGQ